MKSEIRNPKSAGGTGFRPVVSGVAASVLLATGVLAQSNHIPGVQDYPAFSRFIADRNIFDPNRQAHFYSDRPFTSHRSHPAGTPGIQFVGTMSYQKGLFAFFSGNNSDLSTVARAGDKVADYIVTEISPDAVQMESADKKLQFSLRIGDGLRQENGKWVRSAAGDMPAAASAPETSSAVGNDNSSSAPSAPPSVSEPNDVLKRLMQQREKENQ